ncbi:VOC family protein [Aquipuribacter sp. SD81]|uniref:VOC family protein n=1 Tax=Aquipuribacter sp. SD81 TaxID=3127703 RepID=UPI003016D156
MLNRIVSSQLYVLDQDEALDFYVGVLGLRVHTDADLGFMRWLTVCVPDDPDHQILLERPAPPAVDEATAASVRENVAKGAGGGWLMFTTDDARATYERLRAKGVDMTSEPTEQPYGTDFGLRDPFGNAIRIGQLHGPAAS